MVQLSFARSVCFVSLGCAVWALTACAQGSVDDPGTQATTPDRASALGPDQTPSAAPDAGRRGDDASLPDPSSQDGSSGGNDSATANDATGNDASDAPSGSDASVVDAKPDSAATCTAPVPGGACGLVPQCGCGAGLKCDEVGGGLTACTAAGSVGIGKLCSSPAQCGPGTTCVDSACEPFCATAADCTGPGRACMPIYQGGSLPVPGFFTCSSGCDLVNPSATCGPGLTCFPYTLATTSCVGPVTATVNPSTCTGTVECVPGYLCGSTNQCQKWCKIGGTDCSAGQTCTAIPAGLVTIGVVSYGTCI